MENRISREDMMHVHCVEYSYSTDPLTALMYAVHLMNFLKTLITKRLRDREESRIDPPPTSCASPPNESGRQSPSSQPCRLEDEDTETPFDDGPLDHRTQYEDGDDSDDGKCVQSRDESQDMVGPSEKSKSRSNLSCINTRIDRVEAWR